MEPENLDGSTPVPGQVCCVQPRPPSGAGQGARSAVVGACRMAQITLGTYPASTFNWNETSSDINFRKILTSSSPCGSASKMWQEPRWNQSALLVPAPVPPIDAYKMPTAAKRAPEVNTPIPLRSKGMPSNSDSDLLRYYRRLRERSLAVLY